MSKKITYGFLLVLITSALISILLNIQGVRILLGVFVYLFLPGFLLLEILNVDLGKTKTILFSLGLSVLILMGIGLVIDQISFYFGVEKPLSKLYIIPLITIIIGILTIFSYQKRENLFELDKPNFSSYHFFTGLGSVSLLLFSIFSINWMNLYHENLFLILFYFLAIVWVSVVVFLERIPEETYPFVILIVAISLIIPYSLRGSYIIGSDINSSFLLFKRISTNSHWYVLSKDNILMSCLSINFLPVIIQRIFGLGNHLIFKLVLPLIFSFTSLSIYEISKKFLSKNFSFLASIFFMSSITFHSAPANPRTVIAIFFVSLIVLLILTEKINSRIKFSLFTCLSFGIIVSHYGTAYLFLFSMIFIWITNKILKHFKKEETLLKEINLNNIALYLGILYIWFLYVSTAALKGGGRRIVRTLINITKVFQEEAKGSTVHAATGENIVQKGIPHQIQFVSSWLVIFIIGMGGLYLLHKILTRKNRIKDELSHFVLAISGGIIMSSFVILPIISTGFSMQRVYMYSTIFLSSVFVIGGTFYLKNKKKTAILVLLIIISIFLLSNSNVIYHIGGYERGVTLSNDGYWYDRYYVGEYDVRSSQWMSEHNDDKIVYSPIMGKIDWVWRNGSTDTETEGLPLNYSAKQEGYFHLKELNFEEKKIRDGLRYESFDYYTELNKTKGKVYGNGHIKILK